MTLAVPLGRRLGCVPFYLAHSPSSLPPSHEAMRPENMQ